MYDHIPINHEYESLPAGLRQQISKKEWDWTPAAEKQRTLNSFVTPDEGSFDDDVDSGPINDIIDNPEYEW